MGLPPSSSETVASHTCVVRPPWTSFASHLSAPPRLVPTKLLFSSGREALCVFGQVHERSVAARGIRNGDHRRRVQVAVRGHELLTEIEAARDLAFLRFQYRQPDETGQGSHTAFVQLVESRHLRGLQGDCHGLTDYPRGESRCLRSAVKR